MIENNSNYKATNFKIENLSEKYSPIVHFVDLYVNGETHHWGKENEKYFKLAKETIKKAISANNHLKSDNVGKFAIAFTFGFVVYCFGTPGDDGEIDATCVRHSEYEFNGNLSTFEEIAQVIPCQLEDKIKVDETELWNLSPSIKKYYSHPRKTVIREHKYPNKKF